MHLIGFVKVDVFHLLVLVSAQISFCLAASDGEIVRSFESIVDTAHSPVLHNTVSSESLPAANVARVPMDLPLLNPPHLPDGHSSTTGAPVLSPKPLFADAFWGPKLEALRAQTLASPTGSESASSTQVQRLAAELEELIERPSLRVPPPLPVQERRTILQSIAAQFSTRGVIQGPAEVHPFTGSLNPSLLGEVFNPHTNLREHRSNLFVMTAHTVPTTHSVDAGLLLSRTKEHHLYVWKRTPQESGSVFQLIGAIESPTKARQIVAFLTAFKTGKDWRIVGPDAVWDRDGMTALNGRPLKYGQR
ncbi:hypothetical protein PSEUBRA_004850 [Kalmanozyma brasiliensis GHG001]|uniref:uncharacterized protein n=1 Tax=Kalmanozyma brasiliensis (strain GHG001) TaxID=1365824 RepID=UPI002868011B|nr:uncharacterized protein PSEUBRA_004850 [Kalmanozyma brasiliensis GHG001]KAF6767439.1 hypothetical protein PSEUBRA_004850 [Kalmanozyma brasiliensis GHG001]